MARKGQMATIKYQGSFKSVGGRWELFDSSDWDDAGSSSFRLGCGEVILGLEEAVMDMRIGEKRTVEIPPEKGFGEHDETLVQEVSRSVFEDDSMIMPGYFMSLPWEDGVNRPAMCKSASEMTVVLDFNHPFAGCDLKYEVELLDLN